MPRYCTRCGEPRPKTDKTQTKWCGMCRLYQRGWRKSNLAVRRTHGICCVCKSKAVQGKARCAAHLVAAALAAARFRRRRAARVAGWVFWPVEVT